MTLPEAIKILEEHQKWRLGANTPPTNSKLLTEAIDVALNLLKNLTLPK